jgi:uroporphyrin-3 C-methyltransferase
MTEPNPHDPAESPVGPPVPARPRPSVWRQPVLIVAALALALGLWNWYDHRSSTRRLQQELAQRLAAADLQVKESGRIAAEVRETVRESQVKLGVLETRLAESQNQQLALEAMYQELARARDETVLADVEQTLLVANQQLQVAGNVKAALIALQAADSRLARLERPQLAPVRKALARDIDALKRAPFVDVIGIGARLDNLIAGVDAWPLASEPRGRENAAGAKSTDKAAGGGWRAVWDDFWREARELVRIEKVEQDLALIGPQQALLLREHLKLRLLAARVALITHDDKAYRADLKAAREWVARYFDGRSPAVTTAAATLKQLSESEVGIQLPTLAASLDAVQNYRLTRERSK